MPGVRRFVRNGKPDFAAALAAAWLVIAVSVAYAPAGFSQQLTSDSARTLLLQALFLQEQHEHEAALPILRQALQLARISRGLYHEDQLDILASLIESESAQANWEQVDDYFALLRNLYQHLYADDPGRLEQGLARVTDWHVDALRYRLDGRTVPHLREVRHLFKARLQIAESAPSPDPRKIERLQSNIRIAETNLNLFAPDGKGVLREQQALQRELLLSSLR